MREARRLLLPFRSEMIVLVYVRRADGKFRAGERATVADYLVARCPSLGSQRKWLEGYVGRVNPDPSEYARAVDQLPLLTPDVAQAIAETVSRVAASDGEISARENAIISAFLSYAEDRKRSGGSA